MTAQKHSEQIPDKPTMARQDWEELEGVEVLPADPPDEQAALHEGEVPGDLPEEDDDNPCQESDEALPEDGEERVISRNPSKDEGPFDDV